MKSRIIRNYSIIAFSILMISCGSKVPFTRGAPSGGEEKNLSGVSVSPNVADFDRYVKPILEQSCASCHDNPAPDYSTALSLVKVGRPAESELYMRATGQKSHLKILSPDSQQARNIEDWINSSAAATKPAPVVENPRPIEPVAPVTPPATNLACVIVTDTGKQICEDMFNEKILPDLIKSCDRCHDNPGTNYSTALTLIKPGQPLESDLYTRATGLKSHKKVWLKDSESAKNLESWITGK